MSAYNFRLSYPQHFRLLFAYEWRTILNDSTTVIWQNLLFLRHTISSDPTRFHRERYCDPCTAARQPKKRVYMFFIHSNGWSCQFLEMDLKTSLPRKLTFATVDQVREMVCRVGVLKELADQQGFEHGIQIGRGGVYLDLTAEQYAKLKKARG